MDHLFFEFSGVSRRVFSLAREDPELKEGDGSTFLSHKPVFHQEESLWVPTTMVDIVPLPSDHRRDPQIWILFW